jgi:hypothetical protein
VFRKIKKRANRLIFSLNCLLRNYDDIVWLIGSGRSGTTWVSNLINWHGRYREMFEPFHPKYISEMKFLSPHQYFRPGEENKQLQKIASDVFSGEFRHPRVDTYGRVFYRGLLVKDIFANLFSCWVAEKFPEIKIMLLIRNPFAVTLSIFKKKHWFWPTDPCEFLKQENLLHDYLQPCVDLIKKVSLEGDYISKQILIWSIINYVPIQQFGKDAIHVCFYEDIYAEPNAAISNILNYIKNEKDGTPVSLGQEIISRPSRVSGAESNLLNGTSPISSWKSELSPRQIDNGLKILEHFGFDALYGDDSMPRRHLLDGLFGKGH